MAIAIHIPVLLLSDALGGPISRKKKGLDFLYIIYKEYHPVQSQAVRSHEVILYIYKEYHPIQSQAARTHYEVMSYCNSVISKIIVSNYPIIVSN